MRATDYFLEQALPNFFFHLNMAYAILRHNGVELGKGDYIGRLSFRARPRGHLQPDAVAHRDPTEREAGGVAALRREGVALDAEHAEAEALVEAEVLDVGARQSPRGTAARRARGPGDGSAHQPRPDAALAVRREDGQAPQLPDPDVVRDNLRVTDGHAADEATCTSPRSR